MKKKFLSLMMAAAVVATTSVNAFAASDATVSENGGSVDVKITGSVNDELDKAPEGTINVTVPTALTFTVNKDGNFTGTSLTITNNGTEAVDVFAYEFTDINSNSTNGIEVKKTLADEDNRSKVTLNLSGNKGIANFASDAGTGRGVYDADLADATSADGIKLARIDKVGSTQNTGELTLRGDAGKSKTVKVNKAITEDFTLKLKIKKASES
ncbi:MAG: hypothetical protein KHZ09_10020 [Clostridium sp.]|uniref:hypothetical protein n=1 Tax=Clostridium sp. TaxID=1506 RepID=UPI001D8173BF|nr:hypothetical protein [Clostridium sp.]MBS5125773.1 hypothetical protein [Clostridium sp.]